MNTNCDANNESALILSNMFAGITIAKTSASDGTITLTITDGEHRHHPPRNPHIRHLR